MSISFKQYFCLISVLLLAACTSIDELESWPAEIPASAFFLASYQSDELNQSYQSEENYLGWVEIFYQGNMLTPGWLRMSDEVLEDFSGQERARFAMQLESLGQRIAAEWAKDNRARLLDTRCVGVWREALVESLYMNDLENFLLRLDADVEALLAGELSRQSIVFERYYEANIDLF